MKWKKPLALFLASLVVLAAPLTAGAVTTGITQTQVIQDLPTNVPTYSDFFQNAAPEFVIPGLTQNLVPQGICYLKEQNLIAVSYYQGTGSDNSMICLVNPATHLLVKTVKLVSINGSVYKTHAGGLAASDKDLWVISANVANRVPIATLMSTPNEGSLQFVDSFNTGTRSSLATCVDGVLWVGDFFLNSELDSASPSYPTDPTHHMTAPDGSRSGGWMVGFKLDPSTGNEIQASKYIDDQTPVTPDYVIGLPQEIQGVTRLTTGEFVLSQSYGRKNTSHTLIYKNVLTQTPDTNVTINGTSVPFWFFDSRNQLKSIATPPLEEALERVGDRVFVLFEAAASIYIQSDLNSSGNYTTDPVDMVYSLHIDAASLYPTSSDDDSSTPSPSGSGETPTDSQAPTVSGETPTVSGSPTATQNPQTGSGASIPMAVLPVAVLCSAAALGLTLRRGRKHSDS